MDPMTGLLCSLTGQPAAFENECPDFKHDTSVVVAPPSAEAVPAYEAAQVLSADQLRTLRLEQNLPVGIAAAVLAGLAGAILWAAITAATNYQIGYMAVAVGAAVGFAMRIGGKGVDPIFGYAGGAIAVLSCVLGNFLSILVVLADQEGLGYLETLLGFDYSYFIPLMTETFSPIDLLFYGLAAYEGYKFAFRVAEK
jgi:hypothetical protein